MSALIPTFSIVLPNYQTVTYLQGDSAPPGLVKIEYRASHQTLLNGIVYTKYHDVFENLRA